jgi:hypothetical protein
MLVLDANILIRAVLGRRVRELLERYAVRGVRFLAPEAAFEEASKYLPMLLEKRGIPRDDVLASLSELRAIVEAVEADFYRSFERQARQRLRGRVQRPQPKPRAVARMGQSASSRRRTRTSLALESLYGRPTELRFFSNKSRPLLVQKGRSCPSCRFCRSWKRCVVSLTRVVFLSKEPVEFGVPAASVHYSVNGISCRSLL